MKNCILSWSLVGLFMVSAALAGPTVIITDSGTYVMTVGADGVPVTVKADEVLDKRAGGNPQPGPTPTPTPAPTDVTNRIESAARTVNDPNGAVLMAAAVKLLADSKLPPAAYQGETNVLKQALDKVLSTYDFINSGAFPRWKPFRDTLSAILQELTSKGQLQTADQWQTTLNQVSAGLAKAGGSVSQKMIEYVEMAIAAQNQTGHWPDATGGDWWHPILNMLIQALLELIKQWLGV